MAYLRSVLFIPANNPGMVQSADLLQADGIIFDLEDAVAINQKDAARGLLEEAFKFFPKNEVTRIVRINPMDSPFFYEDIEMVKQFDVDYILLAKADKSSVKALGRRLKGTDIKIICLIESAHSVYDLGNVLSAHKRVEGMLFGAEDYSLDMQIERTKQSDEILVARQNIAITCHALDKFSLDTPFTDVEDFDMLVTDTKKAKAYGFSGKACISPRHVPFVNKIFSPTDEEIAYALEVIDAADKAAKEGIGVFSLNGKMVDAPIINRAKLTLENARKAGIKYE